MRYRHAGLGLLLLSLGCASGTNAGGAGDQPVPAGPAVQAPCCSRAILDRGLAIARAYRVSALADRRANHARFWEAVRPSLGRGGLRSTVIGRSLQGRELRAITFGSGPVRVLLWSQMHGNESTATMALADISRFLAEAGDDSLATRLAQRLTIVFVPMLNPDGTELFQRENAAGIDINRDARQLATPEGQALKALRDSLMPAFGFNLHDQNARTRAGDQGPQAAIALLAPAFDDSRGWNPVRTRARHLAAVVAALLEQEIPGRVARYDDSFTPRAFGDLMQQWGTSTILIESGALPDDPQKQRLRALNVAAILGALNAIATGSLEDASTRPYDALPLNAGGASDLLVLGGTLVLPDKPAIRADLAINYDDPLGRSGPRLRDVGDLRDMVAMDTIDATGMFLVPAASSLTSRNGQTWFRLGSPLKLEIRRAPRGAVQRKIE